MPGLTTRDVRSHSEWPDTWYCNTTLDRVNDPSEGRLNKYVFLMGGDVAGGGKAIPPALTLLFGTYFSLRPFT